MTSGPKCRGLCQTGKGTSFTRALKDARSMRLLAAEVSSSCARAHTQGLKCVREDWSFAPLGLVGFPTSPHGSHRGLHSYAASRLVRGALFHRVTEILSFHAHTKAHSLTSSCGTAKAMPFPKPSTPYANLQNISGVHGPYQ